MTFLIKRSLKVSDDEKTTAAELTVRQSIYPLSLVTILFFLWVSCETNPLYTLLICQI
jgi:FHS family L-fucose permease-like MFS transporter